MKKRTLVFGMTMVMSMAMLTGCGNGKKDYLNDIDAFNTLSEVDTDTDDMNELVETMTKAIDDLDVSTDEGKDIKKDMQELMELTGDLLTDLDALAEMDEDELEEMQTKMEELTDSIEDGVEKFRTAAEEAGVDEEDLEDFEDVDLGL